MDMRFHEALTTYRDRVLEKWLALVQGIITPDSMSSIELLDHFPKLLEEVIGELRADAGLPKSPEQRETASGHGEQCLRLGFSLDAVVREFGALRDPMVTTAMDAGVELTFAELQCMFRSLIAGIARAVSEYARQRDAEQQRLHNEHIAFIAHELRNPLASAITAHEVLKRQRYIPPDARAAGVLSRGLKTMQELIDHALTGARAASGIELRCERVGLGELLAEIELGVAGEAEGRDIRLHVRIDRDATLEVDRRLIQSALSNVVRNAVKYTAQGTDIELRGRVDGKHVVIEVEDACGGLPADKLEAAFVPFVRLGRPEPGFGLGLAIAKQAIDAHGGQIRVQNLPGKGCIFVLELPIER